MSTGLDGHQNPVPPSPWPCRVGEVAVYAGGKLGRTCEPVTLSLNEWFVERYERCG